MNTKILIAGVVAVLIVISVLVILYFPSTNYTTSGPLGLTAGAPTASNTSIMAGTNQSTELMSHVTGGKLPYTYEWYRNATRSPGCTPQNSIDVNSPDPVRTPLGTNYFTYSISDSENPSVWICAGNGVEIMVVPKATTTTKTTTAITTQQTTSVPVTTIQLTTTVQPTTTMQPTTTIQSNPEPTNYLTAFWNGLVSLYNAIVLFLLNPTQLSVAGGQNFTTGSAFTAQIGIAIPSQYQTKNFSITNGKIVQQTFCAPFVINNQSTQLLSPTPIPTLALGSTYNTTISYTPTSRQALIIGGVCRTDNITYSYLSGQWGSWSAFKTTANTSAIAHAGINSVTPNPLTQFWNGVLQLWNEITGLFAGL